MHLLQPFLTEAVTWAKGLEKDGHLGTTVEGELYPYFNIVPKYQVPSGQNLNPNPQDLDTAPLIFPVFFGHPKQNSAFPNKDVSVTLKGICFKEITVSHTTDNTTTPPSLDFIVSEGGKRCWCHEIYA